MSKNYPPIKLLSAFLMFLFAFVPIQAQVTYSLVKDAASLSDGDKIIIAAASGEGRALSTQKSNNRAATDITVTDEKIVSPSADVQILTLGEISGGLYSLYTGSSGYLYAASSSSNHLKTKTTLDDNGKWSIVIDETSGSATVKAQGTYTRNWLRYNSSDDLFSCYASGQNNIFIYKEEAVSSEPSMSVSEESLEFKTPVGTLVTKTFTLTVPYGTTVSSQIVGEDAGYFTKSILVQEDESVRNCSVTFRAPIDEIKTCSATLVLTTATASVSIPLTGYTMLSELKERFNCSSTTATSYNTSTSFDDNNDGCDFSWTKGESSVYKANGFVKLGAASKRGTLTSSDLLASIPDGVEVTMRVYAADWKSSSTGTPENALLKVTYNGESQEFPLTDAVAPGSSYTSSQTAIESGIYSDDFANPVEFTLTKEEGVNDIEFTSAGTGYRLIIDAIVVLIPIRTFPEANAVDVELLKTSRMKITFDRTVEGVDLTKVHVSPANWTVTNGTDCRVEHIGNEDSGKTMVFRVNSWDTCLPSYSQDYTVTFEAGAVTFTGGESAPAYSWTFRTQEIGTGVSNVEIARTLSYDGHRVAVAGNRFIEAYNLAGARVAAGYGSVNFDDMPCGVYVVRCDGEVMKVVKR